MTAIEVIVALIVGVVGAAAGYFVWGFLGLWVIDHALGGGRCG